MEDTRNTADPDGVQPKSRRFPLEAALLLLFVAFSMTGAVWTNQIIFQTCTVKFGFSTTECGLLGTHNASKEIEIMVQPYAARILMAHTMIDAIVPSVLGLVIGPWSDRFGRRPVLIGSLLGYTIGYAISAFITWFSIQHSINPWFYLVAVLPPSMMGGFCALLTGSLCYITDVTSRENRAMRMSLMQGVIFAGSLVGNFASNWLISVTSTPAIFAIATGLTGVATLYVICLVEESIQDEAADRRIGSLMKFAALFDVRLVRDIFTTVFRRRENVERPVILLTMLALVSGIFVMNGSDTVFYMFVREKFSWTIQQFNTYDSAVIVTQVAGNLMGLYLMVKCLGLTEATVTIVAFLSFASDYTVKAMATQSWHLYAGLAVACLRFMGSPTCRAILANNVPANEIGKIYAFTTSLESLSALVAAPLYSYVYTSTMAFYPGAFNMISAAVYIFCVFVMMLVKIINRRNTSTATGISYGPIAVD